MIAGRWRPQEIRVWSLAYVSFWAVKTLVRSNPLLLFIGGRIVETDPGVDGGQLGQHAPVNLDLLDDGSEHLPVGDRHPDPVEIIGMVTMGKITEPRTR